MMGINKALILSNISVFVVVAIVIGGIVGASYYEQYQKEQEAAAQAAQQQQSRQSSPPKTTSSSTSQTSAPKPPSQPAPAPPPSQPEIVTASDADYNRLEQILPTNEVIQALPDEARILLSFFNFNSGQREWERDYLIGKGTAVQVNSMPDDLDMKMIMHSRNVPNLKEGNLCDVIATAKKNGDYATELVRSKASLLWKYKGVMSYKDCLGL